MAMGPPETALQRAVVALLRGGPPAGEFDAASIASCLRRYECGGYLASLWSAEGRFSTLPRTWAAALAGANRATRLDSLAALAEFRSISTLLLEQKVPFVLLKGAAYMVDLYRDPAERALTDVDLLIHPEDVSRTARLLTGAGYAGAVGPHYPEDRRFEMRRPGAARCGFEFHWWLGLPLRLRFDQEALWRRSEPCALEGVASLRLEAHDALLYHVGHLADHYFGPSLKWIIDLREMLRRWRIEPGPLLKRAASWRVRTALHLALTHLEKVFPGAAPPGLLDGSAPGPLRRSLLRRHLSDGPAEMLDIDHDGGPRYPIRPLILDRPADAVLLAGRVLARPLARRFRRVFGRGQLPWEASPGPHGSGERGPGAN
jgi:hypothetical protein